MQEKLASLGSLTAGIAHELKNPLNFITNFASLARETAVELGVEIRRPEPDPAEIHDLLKTSNENPGARGKPRQTRGSHRARNAPSFAWPAGQARTADMNAFVEEALSLAYHGIRARDSSFNVTLIRNLDPELPPAWISPQEISRVLVNILNNAFYATGEREKPRSRITFPGPGYLRKTATGFEIVIEDNGVGIPEHVAQKVFEPFFTARPAGVGTGLGLSISYEIVRAHGGSLSVESEPGAFARFHIMLPGVSRFRPCRHETENPRS